MAECYSFPLLGFCHFNSEFIYLLVLPSHSIFHIVEARFLFDHLLFSFVEIVIFLDQFEFLFGKLVAYVVVLFAKIFYQALDVL